MRQRVAAPRVGNFAHKAIGIFLASLTLSTVHHRSVRDERPRSD